MDTTIYKLLNDFKKELAEEKPAQEWVPIQIKLTNWLRSLLKSDFVITKSQGDQILATLYCMNEEPVFHQELGLFQLATYIHSLEAVRQEIKGPHFMD